MKLKLAHYNRGKLLQCKQDEIWFIIVRREPVSKDNPEMLAYWDNNRQMPYECMCYSIAAYYSYDLALNAFNKIQDWYKRSEFQTLKEVTI